jgi:hypothetical protein
LKNKWQRILAAYMEALEVPGQDTPVYKPRHGTYVWVVVGYGETPAPPPSLERQDVATRGGREVDIDASDPDFLLFHKTIGMTEYTHCIPWDAISDIVFVTKGSA